MINKWKFIYSTPDIEKEFINTPRKICIAAHSTPYFDGIILYQALKYFGEDNPQAYVRGYCPYFPKWCIPISNVGGFIKNEILSLKTRQNFCRILFPSGGTIKWKTGFYVLAKELDAKIIILGIDYNARSVVVDSIISPLDTFEETKKISLTQLRKYSPGPFCFILRVLCNYGCEAHNYNKSSLYFYRCLCIFIGFYIFYIYSSTRDCQ